MTSSNRSAPTSGNRPLSRRTVVVTRPSLQAGPLIEALERNGAAVLFIPAFKVISLEHPGFIKALEQLPDATAETALFFTSVNAVEHYALACRSAAQTPGAIGEAFVACVGPATRDALRALGIGPRLTAEVHTAGGLVDAVAKARGTATAAITHAMFPCARDATETLESGLTALGITVERYEINCAVAEAPAPAFQSIPDVVTFASPSAASMFEQIIDAGAAELIKRESLAACIGPTTAKRVNELDYDRVLVASVHTVDGIVDALIEHFS